MSFRSSPLPSPQSTPSAPENAAATDEAELPNAVRDKLEAMGVNGTAQLWVKADLDAEGRWGERYLVATPDRVIVVSVNGNGDDNGKDGHSSLVPLPIPGARGADGEPVVTVDLDVPLQDVVAAETKSLVGNASLQVRLRRAGEPAGAARIVELVRSSNAYSRELTGAARQLEQLRDSGMITEVISEEDKSQRRNCPTCGSALPRDSSVCPFCVNKWQALRRLFAYLGPYKWVAIGNGVLSITAIGLDFVSPVVSAMLIDRIFPKQTPDATAATAAATAAVDAAALSEKYRVLAFLVGVVVLSSLLSAVFGAVRTRSAATLGARVLHDIRSQLYEQLQRLSLAFYDKREVGAIMSRVQNDVNMLQNFLLDALENIIISSLTIIAVVVIMLYHSWTLALAVLIPVPFVIVGTNRYWRGLMKLWRRVWHQNSSLGARLADTLNGVRVVRAFGQEAREVQRFQNKSGELRDATMRVERKAAVFYPTINFIMGLGLPITWYVGGRQVISGALTFGTLWLFTILLSRLYSSVQQLTRLVNFMTRAMTAAERVFEILDIEPEIRDHPDALPMPTVEGRVEFQNVTFGYDKHRPVLHGVSLSVEAGAMIGLVGHSGAGKSTLINLLMRFYDVDEGAILVDGVDIRNINRDHLRSQIGVVLQEPYLFHGSIYDNIVYGNPDASPGEVMAAARAAFAHDFIVSFPDGYDTVVGERGTRLSGGERQRISIARAILHNPRILILDEATASVDTQTEQQIQMALRNLIQGRTTFAIAHRLSTLRHANRLIVLDHGRIAEQGTHDELMEQHGVFYKLVNAQRAMNEMHAVGG